MKLINNNKPKSMYSGDSKNINVTIQDESGNILDVTGATFLYTIEMRNNPIQKDNQSIGGIVVTDPTNGEIVISLDSSDTEGITGNYFHWLSMADNEGNESTLFHEILEILRK